ncbi:UDP-N-acetylmuramate dehydrogenase [Fastidiosibacter lacustris]|uniref:UDP-N-acetylmuramate dehydrogenase n=1 Tax=Fastidiosibacter lacustris TaxID=2056695 RepID=UPI000E34E763|nr:UDP-N-acetylmuramate dehydrogenase [Fastidiosibacter lacustris]
MISLKPYNTYHIDSRAKYVYFPNTIDEIIQIYQQHLKVIVLGNGSNVILSQSNYFDIAFIILQNNFNGIKTTSDGIYAKAGNLLKELSIYAYEHNLGGMETFFDIPASVGGAMIMNTGAYGDEIYDHLVYVDVLDISTTQIKRYYKPDIHYGYRFSMFRSLNVVILGACFKLLTKDSSAIKAKMDDILKQRQAKLPIEPSAGSVFKRPPYHITVGEMVEKIGLKGYQIGGAQISNKHGGVIINVGEATGMDILKLINAIKYAVSTHYNIKLELEQVVI